MKKRPTKAVFALVAMICSVVLFAVALEAVLRIAFHRSRDFSIEMWKYEAQLKQPDADPQIRFTPGPPLLDSFSTVDFVNG